MHDDFLTFKSGSDGIQVRKVSDVRRWIIVIHDIQSGQFVPVTKLVPDNSANLAGGSCH